MSSVATPIAPGHFAKAILDLPLPILHFKAAEIRNSISHLESSNSQLRPFADDGDIDCVDAIDENKETMLRMEERILLLKREVEKRGFKWGEDIDLRSDDVQNRTDGYAEGGMDVENGEGSAQSIMRDTSARQRERSSSGPTGDEESARRLRERTEEDEEDEEGERNCNGIHL